MRIATIGYERASLGDFLHTLQAERVACVIDVRDLPQSRRAGFSKRQLGASLEEAGIGYVHLKALGTPKEGRTAARTGDTERFWEIVEGQLARPEAELALQQAAEIARAQPSALLCFEADHRTCHRMRVAELLHERYGIEARHLAVQASPASFWPAGEPGAKPPG